MSDQSSLQELAIAIREKAALAGLRFVFAESCTSGLCAASVGSQPGISEFFCGSHVTYRNDSKAKWIGVSPETLKQVGPVSRQVAQQMAAGALSKTPEADIAIAITGHLGPQAPAGLDGLLFLGAAMRHESKINLACFEYVLPQAARAERQCLAAEKVLHCLVRILELHQAVTQVCHAESLFAVIGSEEIKALLPGSFNPVHQGHMEMLKHGSMEIEHDVHFELSVENVDKPDLCVTDCLERALPLCVQHDLVLTRAPTFLTKARLLGGVCFLVGVDTIARIAEAKYYSGEQSRDKALEELRELEVRFLVYGRTMDDSFSTSSDSELEFVELNSLSLPASLQSLCRGVNQTQFRRDVSSRDLR